MITKLISVFTLSLLFAASAQAASLTIGGPGSATVGDSFDITITGDFGADGLLAGGITFFWDASLLQLDSIALELDVISDFSCPGSMNCPPNTANSAPIVWGEFLQDLIDADAGPTLMATLTFTATPGNTEGADAAFMMVTNTDLSGGWFGAGFNPIDVPTFGTYSMQINTVVPLPAAVWLMIGGLGTLLGFRRK